MGRACLLMSIVLFSLCSFFFQACGRAPEIQVVNFKIDPSSVSEGENASLTWNVIGATSVSIDNSIGEVPPSGQLDIKPAQTTTYTVTAKNDAASKQETITIVVKPQPAPVPAAEPIPTISALDTTKLFSYSGKQVQVEGDMTYISRWLPDRYTGQGSTRTWIFIFFMKDIWEGFADNRNMGGSCGQECWRDYTSFFRAIIKPENASDFQPYFEWALGNLPDEAFIIRGGGKTGTSPFQKTSAPGFIVGDPVHIVMSGMIDHYLSAPAIYLTNTNQIVSLTGVQP